MWRPPSRPTRRLARRGRGGRRRLEKSESHPRARRPTEGRRFFLRADGDRPPPGARARSVPSFRPERGVFSWRPHRRFRAGQRQQRAPTRAPPRRAGARRRGFALVLLAAVASLVVALLVGPAPISFGEVVGGAGPPADGADGAASLARHGRLDVRLPRALVGFLVGGGLAVAGAALQGLFRNPLAEPGVLGISSGASLGAVLAIYFQLAGRAVWTLPACAFAGRGHRRHARVRDRGAPRARAGVHGDAAAGRRRARWRSTCR